MKCPHCADSFNEKIEKEYFRLGLDCIGSWFMYRYRCPSCDKYIFILELIPTVKGDHEFTLKEYEPKTILVQPKSSTRPLPPEVPDNYRKDFQEACLVLTDSPKASAALSRRLLQQLLREKADVNPSNLSDEIQHVLDNGNLPSHIFDSIDSIRNIGNFAAHPNKSKSTGEIIDVEPGEAEWNIDVLEALFDFYFVQPEIIRKRREDLNAKLNEAGKPPMKGSSEERGNS